MIEVRNRSQVPTYMDSEERALEILRFLVFGTRGGTNRARILTLLVACPRNPHDLARELDLNYGTVTLHLKTLVTAGLVIPLMGSRYAQGFALSPILRRSGKVPETLAAAAGNGSDRRTRATGSDSQVTGDSRRTHAALTTDG